MRYIELAPWDTENFGFKVGHLVCHMNLDFEKVLAEAKKNDYRLLYCTIDEGQDEPEWLILNAFLADTKLIFQKEIKADKQLFPECESYAASEVSPNLYELAFESGKYSRYKIDPKMPKGIFEKLYTIWIERSVNRQIANDVIILKKDETIRGMVTYKIKDHLVAEVGLIAVNSSDSKRGFGTMLLENLEQKLALQEIRFIEIPTQLTNKPACRFYEKNNYKIINRKNIYHIWL